MKKINWLLCFIFLLTAFQFQALAAVDTSWHMVTTASETPDTDVDSSISSWRSSFSETAADMYVFGGAENSMWLQRELQIPSTADKRFILKLKGLQCNAFVYIKGEGKTSFTKVGGALKGPDCSVDITPAVMPGELVTVKIWITRLWKGMENERENEYFRNAQLEYLNNMSDAQFENSSMLGIKHGGISLVEQSKLAGIDNVRVETSVSEHTLKAVISGYQTDFNTKLRITVRDENNPSAHTPSKTVACNFAGGKQTVTMSWSDAVLWELGKGYLYKMDVEVLDALDRVLEQYPEISFGFREISTDGKELMLNGHKIRLRLAPFGEGGVASMKLYQGIGFNAMIVQPNSTYWWSAKWNGLFPTEDNTAQYCSEEMIKFADENGWAVLMSAPSVDCMKENLALSSPQWQEYKEYFSMWMKECDYQNRPSVFSWTASMNAGSTYDPERLGQSPNGSGVRAEINEKVAQIIKQMDPTRLVFAHHGGKSDKQNSSNDIETLNMYTNHMPIQEVEEYPSVWSKTGDRPWGACEFGVGFSEDFFNNNHVIPQFTEYLARYYGKAAYENQDSHYVEAIEKLVDECNTDGYKTNYFKGNDFFKYNKLDSNTTIFDNLHNWTMLGDYWGDYTKRVYRSWRTYGVNYGMFPFNMDLGFGATGNANYSNSLGNTYRELAYLSDAEKDALLERPEWASVYYDQFQDAVSPLMVYIGGELYDDEGNFTDNFTDKSHNYFSGETIRKSLITVWDGPDDGNETDIALSWTAKLGDVSISGAATQLKLHAGDINKTSIQFTAPDVAEKSTVTIALSATDSNGKLLKNDTMELTIFPTAQNIKNQKKWAIYDPMGTTKAELSQYGLSLTEISKGSDLSLYSVLVIGKACITDANSLPYTSEDLARGLKILVMEQNEAGLQALGFRTEDNMPRNAFANETNTNLLQGLGDKDLSNWRGSGSLLPEKEFNEYQRDHAPHWKNTNSVSSVTIEVPQKGAFLPVAVAEFDLQYTPLLLFRDGMGEMLFCQFDMAGRINREPAANTLMRNIVNYLEENHEEQGKRLSYIGEQSGDLKILDALGFDLSKASDINAMTPQNDILVIGELPTDCSKLVDFAEAGGAVLILPQWDNDLNRTNLESLLDFPDNTLSVSEKTMNLVKPSQIVYTEMMNGVGSQLMNFRRNITVDAFEDGNADGLILEKNYPSGGEIMFLQLDIRTVCADAQKITAVQNVQQPKLNAYRLYRQILSNMGAKTSQVVSAHMMNKEGGA